MFLIVSNDQVSDLFWTILAILDHFGQFSMGATVQKDGQFQNSR